MIAASSMVKRSALAKRAIGSYHNYMKHFSLKEAKDRLSELVRLMESGQRVIVTRHGEPAFEMVKPRRGGIDFDALDRWKEARGLPHNIVGPIPKDFDDPLPEDFLITPIRYPDETGQP